MKKQLTAAALAALIAAGALPVSACAAEAEGDMAPVKTPALNTTDHMQYMNGYEDGTFRPDATITRAEACSIVNRTTKRVPDADHLLAEDQMRNWPDNANTSAWYYADMQEATNGHYYDYVLDDNEEIVREEWTSAREPIDWDQVEAELEASH